MAKIKTSVSNKTTSNTSTAGIIASIFCLLLSASVVRGSGAILFYQPPAEIASGIRTLIGWALLIIAIWLFLERKDLNYKKVSNALISLFVGFVFCVGLLLVSAERQVMLQSDGFSVTGGILMFLSGIYFGYKVRNGQK